MKHILFILCMATLLFSLSSCAPYGTVYASGGYRPGYARPSYAWNSPYRGNYYSRGRVYNPPHRHHHHASRYDSRNRYYGSRSSSWNNVSRTRVNAGPVRLSNTNWRGF